MKRLIIALLVISIAASLLGAHGMRRCIDELRRVPIVRMIDRTFPRLPKAHHPAPHTHHPWP